MNDLEFELLWLFIGEFVLRATKFFLLTLGAWTFVLFPREIRVQFRDLMEYPVEEEVSRFLMLAFFGLLL